jgi:hypothetical protein
VIYGWRPSTIDINLRLEPERDELLRAIVELKERLSVNVPAFQSQVEAALRSG